ETLADGGAAPAVEAALRAGFTDIWVVGGDGTVRQCLRPIVEAGATLGVVPAGTSNCLAMEIGPMPPNPAMRAGWMLRQPVARMDLGECNGELFAVRMGVGLEAMAARLAERDKRGLGPLAYLMAGVQAMAQCNPPRLRVICEGEVIYARKALAAIFSNLPLHPMLSFAGRERAAPTDGRLHATIVEDEPIATHFAEWVAGVTRGDPHLEGIVEHRATEFDITAEGGAHVHLDGEDQGVLERAMVRCRPEELRIRGLSSPPSPAV
ncbi:MAG: hypothetical protein J7M38_06425, partial [Armatimonadetes bacterium]|nr:hypothetical protein [Armatimonadota bacterium]